MQALRRSGVRDPVLLLDEVDKMGHDSLRGDPASALLEVLDPNQNQAFVDTYLSVPFDLSQACHAHQAFLILQTLFGSPLCCLLFALLPLAARSVNSLIADIAV